MVAAFRVNPKERRQLQRAAQEKGIKVSDLLRLMVFGSAEECASNKQ